MLDISWAVFLKVHATLLLEIKIFGLDFNTLWIFYLCYGQSPTHSNLVKLGEAVNLLKSTELTLRTLRTSGILIGATADYVEAPSNGKLKFNKDKVHVTRTHHRRPDFLCSIDLYVNVESEDILCNNLNKLLLRFARKHLMCFKKKVRKHIYSDSKGKWTRIPLYIMHLNLYMVMLISYQKQVKNGHYEESLADPA
ncbi:hypothetical protein RJ639_019104 [Escallonia herrerae]|uniref:Uncharacterized protein n=1 Tax=Escallonia herrerae TaxID=1293975 RepID=A0AA89AGL8_9ASTE|nr:hypothetical protein RJ639_019104 [Escallonia herrerae]